MKYKYSKIQKVFIIWEILFTVAWFVNSILYLKYEFYYVSRDFASTLPGIHNFIVCVFIAFFYPRRHPSGTAYDPYIKDNYPDIWKRFHHTPGILCNPMTVRSFCKGKYDDGTDKKLNKIKRSVNVYENLSIWPFLSFGILLIFNRCLYVSSN